MFSSWIPAFTRVFTFGILIRYFTGQNAEDIIKVCKIKSIKPNFVFLYILLINKFIPFDWIKLWRINFVLKGYWPQFSHNTDTSIWMLLIVIAANQLLTAIVKDFEIPRILKHSRTFIDEYPTIRFTAAVCVKWQNI